MPFLEKEIARLLYKVGNYLIIPEQATLAPASPDG